MQFEKTDRGFALISFPDQFGNACSVQKSSVACENCIWLGINDPAPQILASEAAAHGVQTDETTGWVPFPIPSEVFINSRMHLTQDMAAALLPILQHFVKTGELPSEVK